MRSKIVLSMCLAGSVSLAGCQRALRSAAEHRVATEVACCNTMNMPPSTPVHGGGQPTPTTTDLPRPFVDGFVTVPEQPTPMLATPGALPFTEKDFQAPPVPPMPPAPAKTPATAPRGPETPLPPPVFPDMLPAPRVVPSSKLEHRPPAKLPVITVPDGDQVVQTAVRTVSVSTADESRCLMGEVQQFRRGWRLRYAAIDAVDPYGGSVSLLGAGLERLKDGARVRVTGTLLPPEDRNGSARFQVQTLEVME